MVLIWQQVKGCCEARGSAHPDDKKFPFCLSRPSADSKSALLSTIFKRKTRKLISEQSNYQKEKLCGLVTARVHSLKPKQPNMLRFKYQTCLAICLALGIFRTIAQQSKPRTWNITRTPFVCSYAVENIHVSGPDVGAELLVLEISKPTNHTSPAETLLMSKHLLTGETPTPAFIKSMTLPELQCGAQDAAGPCEVSVRSALAHQEAPLHFKVQLSAPTIM